MPAPPASGSTKPAAVARGLSPRETARRAIIYRRTRERPRERGLRLLGLFGTLLVHLLVLFGMVLGSAYDLQPPRNVPMEALQVRLIDKPEPPPPPPVRGTPPKQRGPLHRARVPAMHATTSAATPSAAPVPRSPQPQLSTASTPARITPKPVAAPPRPARLPKPQPSPALAPVPLSGAPPQITLAIPPSAQPVPPRFQPEPVRKPQLEGNRPLPPPASLALPEPPAQSPPTVVAPSIALDRQLPVSSAAPASLPLARPLPTPPSPPVMEPVPLSAPPAPTIDLQSAAITPSPDLPRERPRVQVAAIALDRPQLAVIPSTEPPAPIQPAAPSAPALDTHAVTLPLIRPTLARPQLSAADVRAADAAAKAGAPAAAPPTPPATPADAKADATATADSTPENPSADTDLSSAPDATPQGSDTATPGQPSGADNPAAGQTVRSSAAAPARGAGTQGVGKSGTPQPGAAQGPSQGKLGSYIELRPHGDTAIMSHGTPDIGYQPTRFAQDWTPEGESSIDTALRHAVEKTTVKHVFHLPRGVRVKCSVSPLLPIALFGCGSADPPPKLVAEKVYERLDLAPVKPLAEAAPAPARSTAARAPIQIDNSADCAAARISGGPPPPGCGPPANTSPTPRLPAPATSSWVPASDQFH
jgi:hypothetical protein